MRIKRNFHKAAHSLILNLPIGSINKEKTCALLASKGGLTPLDLKLPWMSYSAAFYLKKYLKPGMTVFEYGTGGSTLFFLNLGCNVVSVEHDPSWLDEVKYSVATRSSNKNYKLSLREPSYVNSRTDYANEMNCVSFDSGFDGYDFSSYVRHIEEFDDNYFDMVLVDGRARRSCLHYSFPKVKTNGLVVLDNTERSYYLDGEIQVMKSFKWITRIEGIPPSLNHKTECTIFRKFISDETIELNKVHRNL